MTTTQVQTLATTQIALGLGTEGLQLFVPAGSLPTDANPLVLDFCTASIEELGHRDSSPRPFDWENLLPLLQPGEELLWIVDYHRGDTDLDRERVELSLALRFNRSVVADVRDLELRRSRFEAVLGQFRRQAFPESQLVVHGPDKAWNLSAPVDAGAPPATWCIVGTPSPKVLADDDAQAVRDDERPVYQSLNDVVESCLHLRRFRIVFVVGRVSEAEVDSTLASVTALRDRLHPLLEQQHAAMQNEARTWMDQRGTSTTESESRSEQDDLANRIVRWVAQLVGGAKAGRGQAYRWENAPTQRTGGRSDTTSTSSGGQTVDGTSTTTTRIASGLQLADESLDRYARALYQARATGGFRGAVLVQADESDARLVADALRGVLSGARSKDRPLTLAPVRGEADRLLRSNTPILDLLAPAPPILTDDQAGQLLLLPEAELPGLRMHRSVFLGRNARPPGAKGPTIRLGRFAFSDRRSRAADVEIAADDLFRHVLVCGTTGAGKTRRVVNLLNGMFDLGGDVRIVVFETAKRTYRKEFCRDPERPPQVYTVGNSAENPLRINPFCFEPGTSLKRHVSVLADALAELMPTEALIGPKMREAVERAYLDAGWSIETGQCGHPGPPRYPTVVELVATLRRVAAELKYGREVSANYLGALEGRARVFLDATFQDIFSHRGDRTIDEIFDRDTIIELEGLPSSEIDLPAFLLSLLLERLRSHQARSSGTRWLLVIEEAHNVLPREAEQAGSSREARGGHTLVKNLVRLLQEGRELGIGVVIVDQAPTLLARSVLKNTNTKVVMRLEDGEEIAEMGQALGLPEDVWPDLGLLRQGEAVIKASYMAQPVKSSRFAEADLPRSRPDESQRREPPDYASLERLWAGALSGRVRPDARWMDDVFRAARGDGELVRFGLGRALLRDDASAHAPSLLARFSALPASRGALGELAEAIFVREIGEAARARLLPLERWVIAALVGQPLTGARPDVRGVDDAASILGRDEGDRLGWRRALGALVQGNPAQVRERCASRPLLDAAVRLGAVRARKRVEVLLLAEAFDALALLSAVGRSVDESLELIQDPDGRIRTALVAGIGRVLVRMERRAVSAEVEAWLEAP